MGNNISLCLMGVCQIIGFSLNSINQNSETNQQDSTFVSDNFPLNDWSYRVSLFASYGVLTDDLDDNFKNIILYGISASFQYKKTASLNTGVVLGLSKLKENITIDDGIWNKGYKAEIFILETSVGFPLIDEKSFKIAPYFGIASTIINGKKEIYLSDAYRLEERYNVEFNNTTFLLGFNIDIKMKPKTLEYYYVTIGYAYYSPNFEKKYHRFNGNIHLLSLGWGKFSRPNNKRVLKKN